MTVPLVAATYFGANLDKTRHFLKRGVVFHRRMTPLRSKL
jgi:hypothetical protein